MNLQAKLAKLEEVKSACQTASPARERITALFDEGTFVELDGFVACGSEGCKQHQSGQNETQSTFFHIESSVFCFFSGDGPGKFCFAAIVLLTVRLEAMRFFLS